MSMSDDTTIVNEQSVKFERDERGLLKGINYIFNADGW